MPNGIWDEDTFVTTTDEVTYRKMTFHMIKAVFDNQVAQKTENEPRFKTLENRKWKDKGVAAVAGLIGGALANIGRKII